MQVTSNAYFQCILVHDGPNKYSGKLPTGKVNIFYGTRTYICSDFRNNLFYRISNCRPKESLHLKNLYLQHKWSLHDEDYEDLCRAFKFNQV